MNWIGKILGFGKGGGIGDTAVKIREAIVGKELDPEKQMEKLQKLAQWQLEVNKIEAQNRSLFVAGWRPFIGWICGVAFFYTVIIRDILNCLTDKQFPAIDDGLLFPVMMGMLGLGGLRTFEKIKGKTN